jgi:hypothetical protein
MGAREDTFGAQAGPTTPIVGTTPPGEMQDRGRRGSVRASRVSEKPVTAATLPAGAREPW